MEEGLILISLTAESSAGVVIFETNVESITEEVLGRLTALPPKEQVILEVGLESSSDWVQESCYIRHVSLPYLEHILQQVRCL